MVVVIFVAMFVNGGDDIAGIRRKRTALHADEHAKNHDGFEKNSHDDEGKIGRVADGSSHFGLMTEGSGSERAGHMARVSPFS